MWRSHYVTIYVTVTSKSPHSTVGLYTSQLFTDSPSAVVAYSMVHLMCLSVSQLFTICGHRLLGCRLGVAESVHDDVWPLIRPIGNLHTNPDPAGCQIQVDRSTISPDGTVVLPSGLLERVKE